MSNTARLLMATDSKRTGKTPNTTSTSASPAPTNDDRKTINNNLANNNSNTLVKRNNKMKPTPLSSDMTLKVGDQFPIELFRQLTICWVWRLMALLLHGDSVRHQTNG